MTTNKSVLRAVWRYVGAYRPLLLLSVVFAACSVAGTLYVPILIGRAIDCIIDGGGTDFSALWRLLLIGGAVVLGVALCQWLMRVIHNRITFYVVRDLRAAAFSKLQRLPLSYIDTHSHGDTVSRMITDVDQFADGLLMGFTQLFTGVLTILGTLAFLIYLSPWIALIVVAVTPLSLFAARFISTRTFRLFRRQTEVRGEETAFINEMVGNLRVVKAFGHEEQNRVAYAALSEKLRVCSLKAIFFSSLTNPVTRFVNSVVYAGVALVGALTAMVNPLFTVGLFSSCLAYANQYTKPFNEISGVLTELTGAVAAAGRVIDILDSPEETPDPEKPEDPEWVEGAVSFRDVSFSYVPEKPLIRHFSQEVTAGKRIALVGPTGCGKTTLINLLMRFYDVNEGAIAVDGIDTRRMSRHGLRAHYGMVLQETWLKNATVFENIAMGKPDATREQVEEAARAVHAHSFIKRLPQGYDTMLGEDGGSLSQGQKQLLCIARVMLALPPMLILDEATSSIDTRTELKIQDAFARLMKGRTSFIVAHRLSTIREADLILVMRDGDIIERGTHEQLLAAGGFYANLYNSQFA